MKHTRLNGALRWVQRGKPVTVFEALVAVSIVVMIAWPGFSGADQSDTTPCPEGEVRSDNSCMKVPELVSKQAPQYPAKARRNHLEGKVSVRFLITEKGTVDEVAVEKCTPPGVGFEEATVAAVKKWRYRPATKDGKPVPVHNTVDIDFRP